MSWFEIDEEVVEIKQGTSRIGRSMTADIRFEDPSVGNRHALLIRDGNVVRVLDDRGPGVHVNGMRITARVLKDGDVVAVGRHELRYLATVGSPTRPVAA